MADSTLARLGSIAERRWGMFTTSQAETAGVARKQLVRMTVSGAIERLAHGVYRVAGAPPQPNENIYATWLALGGATGARTDSGVASLVAGGITAAVVHEIGDFFLEAIDFIVGSRKTTRLPDVRLRTRRLALDEVIPVNGLPTLTVERTIVDLVELGTDTSLVADALRDAIRLGMIVAPRRLRADLAALPAKRSVDAERITLELDWRTAGAVDTAGYDLVMDNTAPPLTSGPLAGPTGRRVAAHRDKLRAVLRRHGVTHAEIFGSIARGDDHEGSDLDLLVDLAPDTDLFDLVRIKAELEEVLGGPVDLIPRDGLKERVRASATKDLMPL